MGGAGEPEEGELGIGARIYGGRVCINGDVFGSKIIEKYIYFKWCFEGLVDRGVRTKIIRIIRIRSPSCHGP